MVENVVDLPAELQVQLLRDFRIFEQTGIVVSKVGQAKEVTRAGADITQQGLRQREAAGVDAAKANSAGARSGNGSSCRASQGRWMNLPWISVGVNALNGGNISE